MAIVILALALSVLLSAHDGGLRGAAALDEYLQARLLAQSLLAQWSRHRVPQAPSQGQSGRFTWTVSVAPYAGAAGSPQSEPAPWILHQLTVTVAWRPGRRLELATLRLLRVQ